MYVYWCSYIINPCKYAQQIAFNERRWFLQKRYSQFDKLDQTVLVFVSAYVRACVCSCVHACVRVTQFDFPSVKLPVGVSICLFICGVSAYVLLYLSCSICLCVRVLFWSANDTSTYLSVCVFACACESCLCDYAPAYCMLFVCMCVKYPPLFLLAM